MIDADRAAAALSGKSIGQGNSKGQDVDQILRNGDPCQDSQILHGVHAVAIYTRTRSGYSCLSLQELCERKNLSSEIGSIAQEKWVHSRASDGTNTVDIFASHGSRCK